MVLRDLPTATVATFWGLALLIVTLVALPTVVSAEPIGGPGNVNCPNNTCQGSTYTLSYSGTPLPDSDSAHETFRIVYTIDTSTYIGGGVRIDNVALKVSDHTVNVSLFDAPGGAIGNWELILGGINSAGCSGSGSGFECANDISLLGVAPVPSSQEPYSWVFDVTLDNGTLLTGINQASIKARYVDANGKKIGALVSENITVQVPEASATALLCMALVGVGLLARKKLPVQRS